MKKNVVQDVVPGKKSIRNVTLPGREGSRESGRSADKPIVISRHREEDDEFTRPVAMKTQKIEPPIRVVPPQAAQTPPPPKAPAGIPSYSYEYDEPKKRSGRKWLYAALGILVLALAFGVSTFFKSATIRITPKQETVTVNDSFKATKDASDDALGFQIVSVSKDVEKTVPAGSEQQVDTKASGTIIIYNNTAQSQKLVATTRFETPEGLIFRLPSAVTVPAQSTSGGKTIPGSVEVTVAADKTGPAYNVGLKDFTLPGLKGDPKYQTVYARSKTEMTGGFSGKQRTVAPDTLAQANADMQATLAQSLQKDIATQIPSDFVLYSASLFYSFDPASQASTTPDGAVLSKKGTATAVIFSRTALTKAILGKAEPTITPDLASIDNLDDLAFSYATSTTSFFNPATDTSLAFTLKGDANVVYTVDASKLKTDLLGLSRTRAKSVLTTYSSIDEAWVETHPFWNQTIPKDPSKVTIENTLTK
jgi:hypothetical protein